jgi:hypothetical protein
MIRRIIVGAIVVSGLSIGLSYPAFADPCYTGCGPGPVSIVGSGSVPPGLLNSQSPHAPLPAPTESVPAPPGLPFTGADIEQIVGIASVLLVGGVVLVRINRRRARAAP